MDGLCVLLHVSASSLLLLLLVATGPVSSETSTCRIVDCPNFRAIHYYEELGCERSGDSDDCCPTRFDCSPLTSLDKTKCLYNEKPYGHNSILFHGKWGALKSPCMQICRCYILPEGIWKGEARFSCDDTRCSHLTVPDGCYPTYSLDQCCSSGQKCASDANLTECAYKGKTYLEGQLIEAANSECMKCVCQEGYDGTLEGPWCQRRSCDYNFSWTLSVLRGCAPLFYEDDKCCADDFHCPSAEDIVVRHSENSTTNEDEQCLCGEHRLNIGDERLATDVHSIKCTCEIPPFMTCVKPSIPIFDP
ncbi:uncharacterized protein LOC124777772 [Schistocerca piceifrons]|uniref:uncharacterized protein LOC124777772 n=1 Tax=Schistocerca piceifrons TaxID=274613 RepID=UPI001F5FBEF2|nr:uncharacterized protein LOC124777772 [Schistocerca piceifrons]